MSQATGPDEPPEIPIRIAPDWLTPPARVGTTREPWYYGFLEKYARFLLVLGVVTFAVFAMAFLGTLFFPEAVLPFYRSKVAPLLLTVAGGEPGAAVLPAFGGRLLVATVVLGAGFLGGLLPVLLSVAYVLLCVDAGRNLRAIRGGRPGG